MEPNEGQETAAMRETRKMGHYPHEDGLTRGTIIEYDDWQWGVVTELAVDHDPTRVGFVLLDELGDDVTKRLEDAWGCWEHFEVVRAFRDTEHEYWADIEYVTEDDVWGVIGPIHPEERSDGGQT